MLSERFFGSRMPVSVEWLRVLPSLPRGGFVDVVMKVLMGRPVEGVDVDGRAGSGALCRQWW